MPTDDIPALRVIVRADPDCPTTGYLQAGSLVVPVALGRAGVAAQKREGDGATPAGSWPLRCVFYRRDTVSGLVCGLPQQPIRPSDGWSDDPRDPDYNRLVAFPPTGSRCFSAERMWRDDDLYDIVVVVGHNDDPPVPGLGSAIFMHLARPDFSPTEGCIAMRRADMLAFCKLIGPQTLLDIVLPEGGNAASRTVAPD